EECYEVVEDIIKELHFDENEEQERSFRIIAEHFLQGSTDSLQMFLTGIGGSGKSFVIKAV
ncbi:hypothetical protein BJ138DRAFT_979163, partial [Hygrophoropsis aurantiaca]